jgi:hypothetical protein
VILLVSSTTQGQRQRVKGEEAGKRGGSNATTNRERKGPLQTALLLRRGGREESKRVQQLKQ